MRSASHSVLCSALRSSSKSSLTPATSPKVAKATSSSSLYASKAAKTHKESSKKHPSAVNDEHPYILRVFEVNPENPDVSKRIALIFILQ